MKLNRYRPKDCRKATIVGKEVQSAMGDLRQSEAEAPIYGHFDTTVSKAMLFEVKQVCCVLQFLFSASFHFSKFLANVVGSWIALGHINQQLALIFAIKVHGVPFGAVCGERQQHKPAWRTIQNGSVA